MLLQFYNLRDQPFGVTPDPDYLYLGSTHRKALESLVNAVESGVGFSALIAPPGMGKTTLVVALLDHFEKSARTAVLFGTQCDPEKLLHSLLEDFEIDKEGAGGDEASVLNSIHGFLRDNAHAGRPVLVVVDEAQDLPIPAFETLRLLSNIETPKAKLLHIVLAGQPQLTRELAQPQLEQFRQRVTISCKLDPLTAAETMKYVAYRLRRAGYRGGLLFTPEALAMLAASGRGIPREINRLCFNALSAGFELRKRVIDATVMGRAVNQLRDLLGKADGQQIQESSSPSSALTPRDLGLLFTRAMEEPAQGKQQARSTSNHSSSDAGTGIPLGRNVNGAPQPPTGEVTRTAWMETLNLLAEQDALSWAGAKRSGAGAMLKRYGLPAAAVAAAVVLCAGLVWFDRIAPTISAIQDRVMRRGEYDRVLARQNSGAGMANSVTPGWNGQPTARSSNLANEPLGAEATNESDAAGDSAIFSSGAANGKSSALDPRQSNPFTKSTQASPRTNKRQEAAEGRQPRANLKDDSAGQAARRAVPAASLVAAIPPAPPTAAAPALPATTPGGGVAEVSKPLSSARTDGINPADHAGTAQGSEEHNQGTIVARKLLRRVSPVYPEMARARGISGGVVLSAHISSAGRVEALRVVSGDPLLAQAAIDAVRQWVYSPLLRNGEAQPSDETIVVGFALR